MLRSLRGEAKEPTKEQVKEIEKIKKENPSDWKDKVGDFAMKSGLGALTVVGCLMAPWSSGCSLFRRSSRRETKEEEKKDEEKKEKKTDGRRKTSKKLRRHLRRR